MLTSICLGVVMINPICIINTLNFIQDLISPMLFPLSICNASPHTLARICLKCFVHSWSLVCCWWICSCTWSWFHLGYPNESLIQISLGPIINAWTWYFSSWHGVMPIRSLLEISPWAICIISSIPISPCFIWGAFLPIETCLLSVLALFLWMFGGLCPWIPYLCICSNLSVYSLSCSIPSSCIMLSICHIYMKLFIV